jgi:hypothetical protein
MDPAEADVTITSSYTLRILLDDRTKIDRLVLSYYIELAFGYYRYFLDLNDLMGVLGAGFWPA